MAPLDLALMHLAQATDQIARDIRDSTPDTDLFTLACAQRAALDCCQRLTDAGALPGPPAQDPPTATSLALIQDALHTLQDTPERDRDTLIASIRLDLVELHDLLTP